MDPELIDSLRIDLAAADYRPGSVELLLGAAADGARQRGVFAPARRALAERGEIGERGERPLATLARVFLLGEEVPGDALDAALPALGRDGAVELGIAARGAGGGYRAELSLNPATLPGRGLPSDPTSERAADRWILSDLDDHLRRGPARPDHVMGVGGATRSLLAQADPRDAESALDLGTGCGVVALFLAAAGVRRVVATDISERALRLARANARLNGFDTIEFRHGSLFEPVAGERFDLILSNPPFVITPRGADDRPVYEYRDGGMTGDELAATVVRRAPEHLAEGGALLCLANWETPWGGNGLERVRRWIEDAAQASGPLAGWAIERDRVDPVRYAETWARDGGARPGDAAFERLMEDWGDDFAARRVVAIGLGSVRMRRLAAAPGGSVIRVEQAPGSFAEHPGPGLGAAFDAAIAAERMSDAEALGTRWVLADHVAEQRAHRPGEEAPRAIALTADRPVARRVTADPLLAAAVGACDGDLTLGQIADALATLLEVDVDAASEALVAGVRELAWFGMLSPDARRSVE